MSEPYVTIGGKQVYPHPPTNPAAHAFRGAAPVTWEEGWQRETTRVSVPIGTVVALALIALLIWRLLRKG